MKRVYVLQRRILLHAKGSVFSIQFRGFSYRRTRKICSQRFIGKKLNVSTICQVSIANGCSSRVLGVATRCCPWTILRPVCQLSRIWLMKAKKPKKTDEGGLCASKEAFAGTRAPFTCFFLCLHRPVRSGVCVGAGVSTAPDRKIIPNVPTRTCVRRIGITMPSPIVPAMVSNAYAADTSCTASIDGDIVEVSPGFRSLLHSWLFLRQTPLQTVKSSPHA